MANIIRLGSLYLCGNPVSVEDDYLSRPNWSIEIGETVPGKEISCCLLYTSPSPRDA